MNKTDLSYDDYNLLIASLEFEMRRWELYTDNPSRQFKSNRINEIIVMLDKLKQMSFNLFVDPDIKPLFPKELSVTHDI
jgi:hypothetical protein